MSKQKNIFDKNIESVLIIRLFQPNISANSLAMFCTKGVGHKDPLSTMQCEKHY